MGDLAGEAVGRVEIYRVEGFSLRVPAQLSEPRAVKDRAAVPVVNVFFDEDMSGTRDLLLQLEYLALDRLLLPIRAHSRVERRLICLESIP